MSRRDRSYWRSLDELARAPEFLEQLEREFPDQSWDSVPPATRRQFLQVMGASVAFAGLTGCRWPREEIVPFAHRSEERIPGVPQRFATAFELGGCAVGMLVTSYDGRPIKAEGNPRHPDSRGALSALGQASVLGLYDPDRSRELVEQDQGQHFTRTWDDFSSFAREHFSVSGPVAGGAGLAILSEGSSSPTMAAMRSRLLEALPEARWYEWEAASRDNLREGCRIAFGRTLRLRPRLDRAQTIACFDADPLLADPAAVRLTHELVSSRHPESGSMSRLWVTEPTLTVTGAAADSRLPVASSSIPWVLVRVAHELVRGHGLTLPAEAAGLLDLDLEADMPGVDERWISELAADLARHPATAVILVGPRQAAAVHALALVLNQALGAIGSTLILSDDPHPERQGHSEAIAELARRLEGDEVNTLVILGGNPVYDAPVDLGFGDLLGRAATTIHLSLYNDETSRRATWHLPRAHGLEAWGDGRASDGTWTMVQPLIEPLYGGKSPIEVLGTILGDELQTGYDMVRAELQRAIGPTDFESRWRQALHDGLVADSAAAEVAPDLNGPGLGQAATELEDLAAAPPPSARTPELVLTIDSKLWDGRFANNGWLQELPDAITKLTWDNAALVSPPSAAELGLAQGDVVAITVAGNTVELPVYVLPGQAPFAIAVALGYGRSAAGRVGDGVGANCYRLRMSDALHSARDVSVRRTGARYPLACTQDHHAIDMVGFRARNARIGELVREATLQEFVHDPEVIHEHVHHPPTVQLWEQRSYEGEQWGMMIDLTSCVGCNACVVACQAENNIPVIGKEQVRNQREMQWIRIDRYFESAPGAAPDEVENANVVFQPMTCEHCETAPCEQVCPVAATQHTEDGLNAMVYNRCIGTRYCSNNCPFKVRRFNFFNYHEELADSIKMQLNPEVTVRSRGVMEKCTFCVQRIEAARIAARREQRPIRDGEVVPACAQTCPGRAIVFGDLNDPSSEVGKLWARPRAYATLAELNIRPRVRYMARIRNRPGDPGTHGKEPGKAS